MTEFSLEVPLRDEDIVKLRIGDTVYFSGEAWTCRSRLQRHIFDEGYTLPFATKDRNILLHVGPIVIRDDGKWKLTAFNLTSSLRFEKWGPRSVKEWRLKAILGKTTMGKSTMLAMRECNCIHATPVGITSNLFLDKIEIKDVYLFDELGSIEAAWILGIKELGPFLVDIDSEGRSYFGEVDVAVNANKRKVYQMLEIPEDFEYTKLY